MTERDWQGRAADYDRQIRAMLVRDRRLLAASEWFRVNIYAKGRAYRL